MAAGRLAGAAAVRAAGALDDLADAAADRCGDAPRSVRLGLERLTDRGLLQDKRVGIDATTLEASEAMRSIVRRGTGESYEEFLTGLARASGMETPTREQAARLDWKREKRTSIKDWKSPTEVRW